MRFKNQQRIIKFLSIIIISHNINSSNFTITPIIIGATGVTMIIGGLQSHLILSDKSLSKYDSFKDCAKVIPGILLLGMISITINYYMLRLFYTLHVCAILPIFAICIRVNAKYYAIYTHTCEAISCIRKQEFNMFLEKALLAYTAGNANHEYCKLVGYIKEINKIGKEAIEELYNQAQSGQSTEIQINTYISHFAKKINALIDTEINSLLDHTKDTDGDSKRRQILVKAVNLTNNITNNIILLINSFTSKFGIELISQEAHNDSGKKAADDDNKISKEFNSCTKKILKILELDDLKKEGESPVTKDQIEKLRKRLKTIVSSVKRALVSDDIVPTIAMVFEIYGKDSVKELIIMYKAFVIFFLENSKEILTLNNELISVILEFIHQHESHFNHFAKSLNDLQLEQILQEIEQDNSDNLEKIISDKIEKMTGALSGKQNFDLDKLGKEIEEIFTSNKDRINKILYSLGIIKQLP